MISLQELEDLCADRMEDAKTLFRSKRYDGAFYLCGYVVEMGLKRRICIALNWQGYPSVTKEFQNLASFKTHDLEMLLHLSGIKEKIKKDFVSEWWVVSAWNPEVRYSSRKQTDQKAEAMLLAVETLLKNL
jgi:HEPN domain-containing protein